MEKEKFESMQTLNKKIEGIDRVISKLNESGEVGTSYYSSLSCRWIPCTVQDEALAKSLLALLKERKKELEREFSEM